MHQHRLHKTTVWIRKRKRKWFLQRSPRTRGGSRDVGGLCACAVEGCVSPVSAPVARLGMRLTNPVCAVIIDETPAETVV